MNHVLQRIAEEIAHALRILSRRRVHQQTAGPPTSRRSSIRGAPSRRSWRTSCARSRFRGKASLAVARPGLGGLGSLHFLVSDAFYLYVCLYFYVFPVAFTSWPQLLSISFSDPGSAFRDRAAEALQSRAANTRASAMEQVV